MHTWGVFLILHCAEYEPVAKYYFFCSACRLNKRNVTDASIHINIVDRPTPLAGLLYSNGVCQLNTSCSCNILTVFLPGSIYQFSVKVWWEGANRNTLALHQHL